jgi:hypothetical protein
VFWSIRHGQCYFADVAIFFANCPLKIIERTRKLEKLNSSGQFAKKNQLATQTNGHRDGVTKTLARGNFMMQNSRFAIS